MNLLFLAPDFFPTWGGVGTYILELIKNMPGNFDIHVITPRRTKFGYDELNSSLQEDLHRNIHIHYVGEAKDTFFYNFSFQLNCKKHVNQMIEKYDIDIIHSQSAMPDLFISPKKLKVPIVTTIHTTIEGQANTIKSSGNKFRQLDLSEKMTLILSYSNNFLENKYYSNERYYITVSEWAKKIISLEKGIDPTRLRAIYNGIDTSTFNPIKQLYAYKYFPELIGIEDPKVLYLSRLIRNKGINNLLKSIPSITKSKNAHFIFAGAGKKPEFNIPNKSYTFLGYIQHTYKPYLYATSDIFVLPSLYENFPISLLEAMASGCAVISTNVGGVPEMITQKKDGVLISPNNPKEIIESVIYLLEDEDLRRNLGSMARRTVEERFKWKESANKTVEYYNDILGA